MKLMQNAAELLSITQAAEILQISPDTLRRWETKGIVNPQRTKGGSRRYTLYDLKIAKLNKRKNRLFHLPTLLTRNYINSKQDLKIALLTSFLWIFALLIYHFLTPIFLRPTNPDQQISLDQLKKQARLVSVSDKFVVLPNPAPTTDKITPPATGSDLLIKQSNNLPALQYTENTNQYYSIPTLIKRI